MQVREPYYQRFMETVGEGWGSLDSFLDRAIGVDDTLREQLQARFVA